MNENYQEQATVFNPMQLQLLRMFSYVRTDEQMKEIKAALCDYFFNRIEEGMNELEASGQWSREKEAEILKEPIHTPYNY